MSPLRLPSRPLLSVRQPPFIRPQSTYQPPNPPNPHRNFYRTFGRPLAKTFLIAMCTFQILYWGWLKLESIETKKEKEEEIDGLQRELRGLVRERSEK